MSSTDLELLRRLRSLLVADRGFTLDLHTGRPVRTGVAVCAVPSRTLVFPLGEWCDQQVLDWVVDVRRFVDGRGRGDLHLGGWRPDDGDEVHLDVVRVVPPERQRLALTMGRLHRQLAAFDLARQVVVEVAA